MVCGVFDFIFDFKHTARKWLTQFHCLLLDFSLTSSFSGRMPRYRTAGWTILPSCWSYTTGICAHSHWHMWAFKMRSSTENTEKRELKKQGSEQKCLLSSEIINHKTTEHATISFSPLGMWSLCSWWHNGSTLKAAECPSKDTWKVQNPSRRCSGISTPSDVNQVFHLLGKKTPGTWTWATSSPSLTEVLMLSSSFVLSYKVQTEFIKEMLQDMK